MGALPARSLVFEMTARYTQADDDLRVIFCLALASSDAQAHPW